MSKSQRTLLLLIGLLTIASTTGFAAASADLSVSLVASLPGELVYTANIVNNGPSTAQHVTLQAQLPPGVDNVSVTPSTCTFLPNAGLQCGLGNLASSATATVVITVHPFTTGDKTAQATVASAISDPNTSNNTASATQSITGVGISDVFVSMAAPNPITLGGSLTYTVTIANLGDDDAQNVLFVDAVAGTAQIIGANSSVGSCTVHTISVTCAIGHMSVNGTATVHVKMIPSIAGAFYNSVWAAPSATTSVDPNLTNNAVTTVTYVNP